MLSSLHPLSWQVHFRIQVRDTHTLQPSYKLATPIVSHANVLLPLPVAQRLITQWTPIAHKLLPAENQVICQYSMDNYFHSMWSQPPSILHTNNVTRDTSFHHLQQWHGTLRPIVSSLDMLDMLIDMAHSGPLYPLLTLQGFGSQKIYCMLMAISLCPSSNHISLLHRP